MLEHQWCIVIFHLYYLASKNAKYHCKHCSHYVIWMNPDLLIYLEHIEFCSISAVCYITVDDILVWEGVMPFTVFLFCWCRSRMVHSVPFFFDIHNIGTASCAAGIHHCSVVYLSNFTDSVRATLKHCGDHTITQADRGENQSMDKSMRHTIKGISPGRGENQRESLRSPHCQ